jgi:hypothetical protein
MVAIILVCPLDVSWQNSVAGLHRLCLPGNGGIHQRQRRGDISSEVFVHLNLRTVNRCNRVGRPLSILICVPVLSPYSVKIFSGY